MPDNNGIKEETGKLVTEKIAGLQEIQNRIMSLEAEIKSSKGGETENLKKIVKEEIKALELEIFNLRVSLLPLFSKSEFAKQEVKKSGFVNWLFKGDKNE